MLQDAQKGLAGRPPSILRSVSAVGASTAGGAPGGSTIGEVSGRRPQAPSPPTADASSTPGSSAAADALEV